MDTNIPYGYCHCGCGRQTSIITANTATRGLVKGEPRRYARGHNSRMGKPDYAVDPDTGCWVWLKSKNPSGYGWSHINRKTMMAHKVYYIRYKGKVPLGLEIDHLCRNKSCVNPDHLEAVTAQENQHRSPHVKLGPEKAQEIRSLIGTTTKAELARRYGVSRAAIRKIASGVLYPP